MAAGTEVQQLCEALIRAETEKDVIDLLREAGYWDRPELWRYYGDVENNWGQSGNQQSLAEAALAEKVVNSIDARLINECLVRDIDPKSQSAPKTIRSAIAQFFEDGSGDKMATGGYVEAWGAREVREVAQGITLCATGVRPKLNITIADCGEGQTPDRLPETILSLSKSNKMYVPFVQGQFNQGGTGALRFCGKNNLQLVVSRRNPKLLPQNGEGRDEHWGFTLVRRERPKGGRRNSVYTYLAPVGVGSDCEEHQGGVLSFAVEDFTIFPGNDGPYDRYASYGTAIKLYEYNYRGERSNILRGKSLLSRLDLLLPEIALPVRLYEYRQNQNGKFLKPGSRETTLLGLLRRLKNNNNVEQEFPISLSFSLQDQSLIAHVFAFKPQGTARRDEDEKVEDEPKKRLGGVRGYRKNEGIVFVRNGQTHGSLPKDFFRRDSVKMKPLADDLLVFVDCDRLSDAVREDLFMPSRDRLADNDFKSALIDGLGKALRDCEQLKVLRNHRQQERLNERLKDDRPLTDVLQSLIKNSPNLKTLLQLGRSIPTPFNTVPSGSEESISFKGEFYPSFFKIKGVEYGIPYKRECPVNQRMRLTFETDVQNNYFTRHIESGHFALSLMGHGEDKKSVSCVGPNLRNGIATVMVDLPDDVETDDKLELVAQIKDSMHSFENPILVTVKPEVQKHRGGNGERNPPNNGEGKKRERPSQLAPPRIERIYRREWNRHSFDEFTAMKVELVGYDGTNDDTEIYTFKVNMDNTPLLNEIKQKRLEDGPARNQFLYANVLVGLSLLLEDKQTGEKTGQDLGEDDKRETVEERIERICRALAPFLLALTSLGTEELGEEEGIEGLEEVG